MKYQVVSQKGRGVDLNRVKRFAHVMQQELAHLRQRDYVLPSVTSQR